MRGSFFDLERVEVLKGPQGTLYGRNASGGALNLISARPTQEFGGYVEAEFGNFDLWSGTGAVTFPSRPNWPCVLLCSDGRDLLDGIHSAVVDRVRCAELAGRREALLIDVHRDVPILERSVKRGTLEQQPPMCQAFVRNGTLVVHRAAVGIVK